MVTSLIARVKRYLGITSPSLEFLAAVRAAKHRPYIEPASLPWYAARGPRDRWETPELAAAARRVRRLIRRHWWALALEPESPIALSVLEAMATPPDLEQPVNAYQQLRELLDAGALELRPEFARKFYENVFGRAEQSATIYICGAKYAKGDRCRAKLCQVAAGFMDTVDPAIVASLSVVPAEQCPNCAHVDTECQCGDLRDCW